MNTEMKTYSESCEECGKEEELKFCDAVSMKVAGIKIKRTKQKGEGSQ